MLNGWVSKNLISTEQAKKISLYEQAKSSSSWVLYGFLILGASIISLGVISLIAENWKDLPDGIKLFVDFLLLTFLASGAYFAWMKKKPILFEVLLLLFMTLCLGTIGLISQIYHTGGKFYHALLLWTVITCGLAGVSKRYFTPFIWTICFLFGLTFTSITSPVFQSFFQKHDPLVFMAIPLLSALLLFICQKVGGEVVQTKPLRHIAVAGGMIALIVGEVLGVGKVIDFSIGAFMLGYVFAVLSAFGIWMSSEYKKPQKILLLATLGLYLIPFHFPFFAINSKVVYALLSISTLASMAVFLASIGLRNLFQFFLVALGIRFLVLYFQALGGLATTGFGLIASGVVIISMVVVWNKYRQKITTWAEGLVK